MEKQTLIFYFDNAIHNGDCNSEVITGEPIKGVKEVIDEFKDKFNIAVVSDRCNGEFGKIDIMQYLDKHNIHYDSVSALEPPAIAYISEVTEGLVNKLRKER